MKTNTKREEEKKIDKIILKWEKRIKYSQEMIEVLKEMKKELKTKKKQ